MIGLVAAGMGCIRAGSASPTCPHTVRLVALDELARRFDIEFVFDGAAVPPSPVVARFLEAVRDATGEASEAG